MSPPVDSVVGTAPGAVRTVPAQPGYVRQRAAELVRRGGGARVLLLRAQPRWSADPILEVEGRRVHVALGISQLAVLDAYASLPDDELLVVLTDRSEDDLGDEVTVHAWRNTVERVDEWSTVPGLFPGAKGTTTELRRRGDWVASALLDHEPRGGWPPAPSLEVDSRLALGSLLAHLLRLSLPSRLDGAVVMSSLGRPDVRSAWATVSAELRRHLTGWAADALGEDVAFALRVASAGSEVAPLSVALAADVLWPDEVPAGYAPSEQQVAARTRLEVYVEGSRLTPLIAQTAARTARVVVERMVTDEVPEVNLVRGQAEALLGDLGWLEGAGTSRVLRAGLTARLRSLAEGLAGDDAAAVEARLDDVRRHGAARAGDLDVHTARMAVRLSRWLATAEPAPAGSLGASLQQQVDDGAWVDRAITPLWKGSDDAPLAAAYQGLVSRALERRHVRDTTAAGHLVEATAADQGASDVTLVEDLLQSVVLPWTGTGADRAGVLLVVLDGMSGAIATEVAQEALELGLVEHVPAKTGRRQAALAGLPSLTRTSRTSLLSGTVRSGGMAEETSAFAAAVRGHLFHKDDLRPEAGSRFAEPVRRAVADPQVPVVGVVINTVDDALHKQDTSTTRWTLDTLSPLRELLNAAALAGRTVVLTSDHGHVLERSSSGRTLDGAQARWRPTSTGEPGDGEVLVSGPRVQAPGGAAVLLWREDTRYGGRQTGYHGGASLAEITVPVLVLRVRNTARSGSVVAGWTEAAPQTPPWWNDPVISQVAPAPADPAPSPTSARRRQPAPSWSRGPTGEDSLFDVPQKVSTPVSPVPVVTEAPVGDLVDELLASGVYDDQRRRAGRRAVPDDVVATVLRTLLSRGGRAHQDTVAAAAGIVTTSVSSTLAAIRRLLNVEGYAVLDTDADRVTVRLDRDLLVEQFELRGGGRG